MRVFAVLLFGMSLAGGADYSLGVGTGPVVRLDAGWEFWKVSGMSLGIETPIAFLGWSKTSIYARGSYAAWYSERITAAVTPGVRLRVGPEWRVSPWVALGAGGATIRRKGWDTNFGLPNAAQNDTSLVFAMNPGLGMDVKVKGNWFFRAEVCGYLYQTPANGFVAAFPFWDDWNVIPAGALSIGWRK